MMNFFCHDDNSVALVNTEFPDDRADRHDLIIRTNIRDDNQLFRVSKKIDLR